MFCPICLLFSSRNVATHFEKITHFERIIKSVLRVYIKFTFENKKNIHEVKLLALSFHLIYGMFKCNNQKFILKMVTIGPADPS